MRLSGIEGVLQDYLAGLKASCAAVGQREVAGDEVEEEVRERSERVGNGGGCSSSTSEGVQTVLQLSLWGCSKWTEECELLAAPPRSRISISLSAPTFPFTSAL